MTEHVRGIVTREIDTNALFEKYTIEEIREIEKKTRQDIERKKEDLRVMVGERYRELIEAADTITEMKSCAENVMKSVVLIQNQCQNLKQSFQAKTLSSMSADKHSNIKKKDKEFYNIAVQIKLLMDMPEKIWSGLDSGHYLQATQLFLLARHVYTHLQLDSRQAGKVLSWFPVLTRQWAAISHFRTTISQSCHSVLQDVNTSNQKTAECLCASLLLEDSTPRQIFSEFLRARTASIEQMFQTSSVAIKTQVCDVVSIIITTVHQIYTIFYSGTDSSLPSNMLMTILGDVTNKGQPGAILKGLESTVSSKYLPQTVPDFRPTLQQHATAIPVSNLQEYSKQWVDSCQEAVNSGLSKLLGFITTVKSLAAIRDQVWELLKQDEKMRSWDAICEQVLKKKLVLWADFFRPLFMARAKALIQSQFDNTLNVCRQHVNKVLTDVGNENDKATCFERDLASYVWQESPKDIPANMAWVSVSNKTLTDGGALTMKARSYTPAVQSLSKTLDTKIKVLLEDCGNYIQLEGEGAGEEGPFNRYSDQEEVRQFLQTASLECINKLLVQLKSELYSCTKQLEGSDDASLKKTIIDRILLMDRFCRAICELTPCFQQCVCWSAEKKESRPPKRMRSPTKVTEHPKWTEVKAALKQFGHEAFDVWTEFLCKSLVSQMRNVLGENSGRSILHTSTRWDDIDIEEETEEGSKIKSIIRVPMQSSWYLQSLLYRLCEEINRVGGHAIHRSTLTKLVERLTDGVLGIYESAVREATSGDGGGDVETQLTQARALQILFDIQFLRSLLPRKEETEANATYRKRLETLVDGLESNIDPFDMDVFTPHIQNHLQRHTRRCNVLYGALTSLDRHALYSLTSKPASSVQQEQHNVLPLSVCQTRFPLLPLSVQTRMSATSQPIVLEPKPKIGLLNPQAGSHSPPPILSPPRESNVSSFFGQMSTIWFSNVKRN